MRLNLLTIQSTAEPDMDMQAGGGGDEPVEALRRRGSSPMPAQRGSSPMAAQSSPMRVQSSSTTMRPHTWSGASPAAHTQDTWSEVRGAPHPSPHPSQNASHALLNNGKLLVNDGHSLVSQGHMCNIEVYRLFIRY